MGDGEPKLVDEYLADEHRRREARLKLPAVTLTEWAELHGEDASSARRWADTRAVKAWKSAGTWLIRPKTPPPTLKPGRKPK